MVSVGGTLWTTCFPASFSKALITPSPQIFAETRPISESKISDFRFKEEALVPDEPYDVFNRRTQLQYGFVMEEVQDAVPDLVMHKSPDGIEHEAMYWKEPGMIALAIKAIQELLARNNELESRIAALENR